MSLLKHSEDGLSRSWVVSKRQGAAYTGGPVAAVDDHTLACLCADRVALLDTGTGLVRRFFPPTDAGGAAQEPIVAFAVSPDGARLVTFGRGLLCRVWSLASGECARSWKAHRLPVQVAAFDASGTLVASAGSDRAVMVWDTDGGFATHSFKGAGGHEAVVTAIAFQPHPVSVQRLVSGGDDGRICVWDLISHSLVAALTEHYASITTLLFSPQAGGHVMISAGRDRVLNVWDLRDVSSGGAGAGATGRRSSGAAAAAAGVGSALKLTVPTFEAVEGGVMLPLEAEGGGAGSGGKEMRFVTAGDRGLLRAWRLTITGGATAASATATSAPTAERRYACACVTSNTAERLQQQERVDGRDGAAATTMVTGEAAQRGEEQPLSRQFERLVLMRAPPAGAAGISGGVAKKRPRASSNSGSGVDSALTSIATAAPPLYQLVAVTRDQTLAVVQLASLGLLRSISGYNDSFTDVKYIPLPLPSKGGGRPRHIFAAATNSEQLRLVDVDSFDTRLCDGHKGVIIALSPSPDGTLVATASKDSTLRIWDVSTGACVALCEGHTESATAVTFPSRFSSARSGATAATSTSWLASGSRDKTLKLWNLEPLLAKLPSPRPPSWDLRALTTALVGKGGMAGELVPDASLLRLRTIGAVVAHEKDINCLACSPNDRLIASASHDRTVRLWSAPDLTPTATLRGHKRGVWAVAFSPSEQLLASASGDRTVRLWSVAKTTGFACLRTLEGHDGPVLTLAFLRRGMQLATGGADGLVKLWGVRDAECVGTFDAHADKVWSLTVRPVAHNDLTDASDDTGPAATGGGGIAEVPEHEVELVTGGGDSVLNVWRDATSAEAGREVAAAEEAILVQQSLYSAMASRDYPRAVSLSLELDQPRRCGDILEDLLENGPAPKVANIPTDVIDARYRDAMLRELDATRLACSGGVDSGARAAAEGGDEAMLLPEGLHPEGVQTLLAVLRKLRPKALARLLSYVREWNAQSRHALLAQRVLHVLLRFFSRSALLGAFSSARAAIAVATEQVFPGVGAMSIPTSGAGGALTHEATLTPLPITVGPAAAGMEDDDAAAVITAATAAAAASAPSAVSSAAAAELRSFVGAALPYTERHFERLDRLLQSTHILDFVLHTAGGALREEDGEGGGADDVLGVLMGAGLSAKAAVVHAPMLVDEDEDDDDEDEEMLDKGSSSWLTLMRS